MVDAWVVNENPDLSHNTWVGYAGESAIASGTDPWNGPANNVGEALRTLLNDNTDAHGSIDGGPDDANDNGNSGSCGSGSCGPGDDWAFSMAIAPF